MVRLKQNFSVEREEAPNVAIIAEKSTSVTVPVPKSGCKICGWTEGMFETINNHLYAQHIDKILGVHISENWRGSAKLCVSHIREYKEKKMKLADEFVHNPVPKLSGLTRKVCSMCLTAVIRYPGHADPPCSNIFYCRPCNRKRKGEMKKRCSICDASIDASKCAEITEKDMKKKLNFFFYTNFQLDDQTPLHLCSHHWINFHSREFKEAHRLKKIAMEQKKCCVCSTPVDASSIRIYDRSIKQKFNEYFGTKCVTTDNTAYFICYPHWTEYSAKEERKEANRLKKIAMEQKKCCVCDIPVDPSSFRISDRFIKQKFNDHFGTKCVTSDKTVYFICYSHWTQFTAKERARCDREREERLLRISSDYAQQYTVVQYVAPVPDGREEMEEFSKIVSIQSQRPCCICGCRVSTRNRLCAGAQITNSKIKEKLNQRFRTKLRLNEDVLFLCNVHWLSVKSKMREEAAEAEKQKSRRFNLAPEGNKVCYLCGTITKEYCSGNSINNFSDIDPAFKTNLDALLRAYVTVTICRAHFNHGFIREEEELETIEWKNSNPIELSNSGILNNQQVTKEEEGGEEGCEDFVEGYQSIDNRESEVYQIDKRETEGDQSIDNRESEGYQIDKREAEWYQSIDTKDDMVDVEQLIGQGQSIGFGSELRESVLQMNTGEALVKEENTIDPNSIELLNSGISTNKQDSKEGIVKVLKEEHQSIDTKEMTIDRFVKDEVINVEQLIGQRYDAVLIDSVHRLNPEILIKEEIIKEEE